MSYLQDQHIAEYGSHGITDFHMLTSKHVGRPRHGSDVFVLCRDGVITMATYGKYTELSKPEFMTNKNGNIIVLDNVKHWCYKEVFLEFRR